MPVITFANTKGGAGKTTAVLLLATELVRRGNSVSIIDTDPQCWISRWWKVAKAPVGLNVISYVTSSAIQTQVRDCRKASDYVLIDLPGAQTPLLPIAIGLSDYVLIPVQGSSMDAQGGAQVLELLKYLDVRGGIRIPHSVVLSRVTSLVTTRALLAVKQVLAQRNVHVLATPIIERSAYRDMFDFSGYLHDMNADKVSNLDKAIQNAARYADEVLDRVSSQKRSDSVSPAAREPEKTAA